MKENFPEIVSKDLSVSDLAVSLEPDGFEGGIDSTSNAQRRALRATALIALLTAACGAAGAVSGEQTEAPLATAEPTRQPEGTNVPFTPADLSIDTFDSRTTMPDQVQAMLDVFRQLAQQDNIDPNSLRWINMLKADNEKEARDFNFAMARAGNALSLSDSDGLSSGPYPTFYLGYENATGELVGGHVVGMRVESDNQGGASFVYRMVDDATWAQLGSENAPQEFKFGQPVFVISLKEGLTLEQARQLKADVLSGKISEEQMLKENVAAITFLKPGDTTANGYEEFSPSSNTEGMDILAQLKDFFGVSVAHAMEAEASETPEALTTPVVSETPETSTTPAISETPEQQLTLEQWATIDKIDAKLLEQRKAELAKAKGIAPETIELIVNFIEGPSGKVALAVDKSTQTVLFISTQDLQNNFQWKLATPGNYWAANGKYIGPIINGNEWKSNKESVKKAFSAGGILGLSGQVRPGPDIVERKPAKAAEYLSVAKEENMAFVFNNVVEPGNFPEGTDASNVDQWLSTRLSEIADVIVNNNPDQPVFIQFNEATQDGNGWNTDNNPLKDKYGENWLGEYLYNLISTTVGKGLIVNKDFIPLINENGMLKATSQTFVHQELIEARRYAFDKLMSDPATAAKLSQMGITKVEDLKVVLGSETYINLDGQARSKIVFSNNPSIDELNTLADTFSDLGGVMLTEMGLFGTDQQKSEFLEKVRTAVHNNPNLLGAMIWNTFNNPDDATDGDYMSSPTLLFNPDGTPTELYFDLLGCK